MSVSNWDDFWCTYNNNDYDNWINRNGVEQDTCCYTCCYTFENGQCLYYHALWFFGTGLILSTLIFGIYVGRLIAVNTLSRCKPFVDTNIGLHGCVSNVDGTYIGGKACTDCGGYGFLILAIPLFILEMLIVAFYVCIKRCRIRFRDMKSELEIEQRELQQQIELQRQRELELQQNQSLENFDVNAISLNDQIKMSDNDNECNICCNLQDKYVILPCEHNIRKTCADQLSKCPYCRQPFNKRNVKVMDNINAIEL